MIGYLIPPQTIHPTVPARFLANDLRIDAPGHRRLGRGQQAVIGTLRTLAREAEKRHAIAQHLLPKRWGHLKSTLLLGVESGQVTHIVLAPVTEGLVGGRILILCDLIHSLCCQ